MDLSIKMFDQDVPLKVSMWVCDENRYFDLVAQRPKSKLWEAASLLFICYTNACRYSRVKPSIDTSEFELWADTQYSTKEGKENIIKVIGSITGELLKMKGDVDAEAAASDDDKKKLTGQLSDSLHTANVD